MNTSLPTISGDLAVGSVLTGNPGDWTGSPSFMYAWYRCDADLGNCSVISGADAWTYTIAADDETHTLMLAVTGTNTGGSNSYGVYTAVIP